MPLSCVTCAPLVWDLFSSDVCMTCVPCAVLLKADTTTSVGMVAKVCALHHVQAARTHIIYGVYRTHTHTVVP